ncbi:IclR family transcriptional regulator [Halosimplex sp. TS25]|uniref:IclR family transcriptional regulator n=1 Tax=Halosimplex rarum TaxID=3396619 RepID=UPI0039EB33DC
MSEQDGTVGAVENSYRILDIVAESDGVTLTEIAERVDLSTTSVHNHLRTLVDQGAVRKDGDRYRAGFRCLTVGGPVRDEHPLYENARQAVDHLYSTTGELSLILTEHRGKSLVLYRREGQDSVSLDMHLGTRQHLHATAGGKAMLAHFDPEDVQSVVDRHGLPARNGNTITDESELREELAVVRDRGYALDREERINGVRGVAAPIRHREDDRVFGAIAVLGPVTRVTGDRFTDEIPELVTRNAETIEVDITYS